MRPLTTATTTALLVALAATSAHAQKKTPLDGAWHQIASHVVAPDTTYNPAAALGLLIVSGTHYSQIYLRPVDGGVTQAAAEPRTPSTAEEKAARYDALTANTGTFEVVDSVATLHLDFAKTPSAQGTTQKRTFRIRHDTLWLTGSRPWAKDSTKSVKTLLTFVREK
ncbi:MAG TPA: lipocalin-like domain-containing protein [Gemmatimonadaceae bacterium]|nr:lipocalin-like domain-containing protein [Gemmatimonadaceae bacterium]